MRTSFLIILLWLATPGAPRAAPTGIDHDQAMQIATADLAERTVCTSVDRIEETPDSWIIHVRLGSSGKPVEGYFIDKKTGKITAPAALPTAVKGAAWLRYQCEYVPPLPVAPAVK